MCLVPSTFLPAVAGACARRGVLLQSIVAMLLGRAAAHAEGKTQPHGRFPKSAWPRLLQRPLRAFRSNLFRSRARTRLRNGKAEIERKREFPSCLATEAVSRLSGVFDPLMSRVRNPSHKFRSRSQRQNQPIFFPGARRKMPKARNTSKTSWQGPTTRCQSCSEVKDAGKIVEYVETWSAGNAQPVDLLGREGTDFIGGETRAYVAKQLDMA